MRRCPAAPRRALARTFITHRQGGCTHASSGLTGNRAARRSVEPSAARGRKHDRIRSARHARPCNVPIHARADGSDPRDERRPHGCTRRQIAGRGVEPAARSPSRPSPAPDGIAIVARAASWTWPRPRPVRAAVDAAAGGARLVLDSRGATFIDSVDAQGAAARRRGARALRDARSCWPASPRRCGGCSTSRARRSCSPIARDRARGARRCSARPRRRGGGAGRRRSRLALLRGRARAQIHEKPACSKSLPAEVASTVVTVRAVAGACRRRPTSASAVQAPVQRVHVSSSPTRSAGGGPSGACRRGARPRTARGSTTPTFSWTISFESVNVAAASAGALGAPIGSRPRADSAVPASSAPYAALSSA